MRKQRGLDMTWQPGMQRLLKQLKQEFHHQLSAEKAKCLAEFADQIYARFWTEDIAEHESDRFYGSTLGSWNFIQEYDSGTPKVRVFNPEYKKHGWQLGHTVVAILSRNMPFITDSVRGELNRRNNTIHIIHSTILSLIRDKNGVLQELLPARSVMAPPKGGKLCEEALLYLEIARCTDEKEIQDIKHTLEDIIGEVSIVVDDFKIMKEKGKMAFNDASHAPQFNPKDTEEVQKFVNWLCTDNFMFLGYEKLTVEYDNGNASVQKIPGSGLGLLRKYDSLSDVDLLREISRSRENNQLIDNQIVFSKASIRSRVHRLVFPDYVNIKSFNAEGLVTGEHRFVGMYTSGIFNLSPTLIPVVRVKLAGVLDRSGIDPRTHEGKDLAAVLEMFPRDELFQSSVDELFETAMAVNQIQERRQVRLFVRKDLFGKFISCLIYVPREIYNTVLRKKIESLLCEVFGAEESEFTTFFSESVLTRTRFVLRVKDTRKIQVDLNSLEKEVVQVTMSWQDHLRHYLLDEFGEEYGSRLGRIYADAFPPGYCDDFSPRTAIDDIKKIATLTSEQDIAMSFYRVFVEQEREVRFRLIHLDTPLPLSDVMPILERLGLRVLGERPYGLKCINTENDETRKIWIHEFSLIHDVSITIELDEVSDIFQEAFSKIWEGKAENDSFNRLIFAVKLGWRQIAILRAYSRYMKQIQFNFSSRYISDTLAKHVSITGLLIELFNVQFNPVLQKNIGNQKKRKEELEQSIVEALESVENLTEDRIIRHYLTLINATLRTNYFQRDYGSGLSADGKEYGELKSYFSFKIAPETIPDIPLPCPMFEIFVYSPRVEGVHLRGGKVARGGLRWSDRLEDYRTEVLGLVKAQQVKNSVIVPTGAKGGFVAKQLPMNAEPDVIQAEGISCYKIFIQGLLDVTDNLLDGKVVPPDQVVRKDDDDTYLVVAADKGTATFSDIANELSLTYRFWLGDAFASGGSAGFDHKKMGITARGAWVSVQRHFREIGINIQNTDFTVVGIGDMGGDVFGNGMLLSKHIKLLCAFNHMHIFIDPDPDPKVSFAERSRLFELPKSSWMDYNASLISDGGGIFKRSAKSITITAAMKKCFDIMANKLTPTELISAVLKAPVDLLWNGGIGTYTKASTETHSEVGDKANDALRVNGCDLRCKVIGEGGNLGLTQLSRVEFALNGGRLNTDFIDNASGVDCSDHEVNIKILLNEVIASEDMTLKQRNKLLVDMTSSVADLVLINNYRQTQAISMAERESFLRMGEYRRLIHAMENEGRLDRQLEFIPEDDELLERKAAGKGLCRPELAVLTSYVKSQLKDVLVETDVPDDPYMLKVAEKAFPKKLRTDFNKKIHTHRLRREIISTQLANDVVNTMGISYVYRLSMSTGVDEGDIVRAYVTARDVFDMTDYWLQIEALDYKVSAKSQMLLMSQLMRLIRRASRWFVRNRREKLDPSVEIDKFRDSVRLLRDRTPEFIRGHTKEHWKQQKEFYINEGVPEELASVGDLYPFLGIIEAAQEMSAPIEKVAELFFSLAETLELDWFARQISNLKIENSWQAMARESYRDDLEWQIRMLTVGAMRHICEKGDVEACLERWMQQQGPLVERWRAMLTQLHASDTPEFAMYAVAIRELLDMAQSSRYGQVN